MDMREAFEADTAEWSSNYNKRDADGSYSDKSVDYAWKNWQRTWQACLSYIGDGSKAEPTANWPQWMKEYQITKHSPAPTAQDSLPNEHGSNRYGLDMAYFRNLINRELNHSRGLHDYKPSELARVFARMAAAADRDVLKEPEFQSAQDSKVPEEKAIEDAPGHYWQRQGYNEKGAWVSGWNDCRKAMLSAAPSIQPDHPEQPIAMVAEQQNEGK